MDCPSEEALIRLALDAHPQLKNLKFNLESRTLLVIHGGSPEEVLGRLQPLGFGAVLTSSFPAVLEADSKGEHSDKAGESRVLKQLLLINAAMFLVELFLGLLGNSTGLIADSLDMLADAAVYGISLYAVGRSLKLKRMAAKSSGWVQVALTLSVLLEVGRRALFGSAPTEQFMIGGAIMALVANLSCVALLARHRDGGIHLKASWIFSTNDALANLGLIIAGVLVAVTGSRWPDLVVGTLVALLVLSGAVRILKLK